MRDGEGRGARREERQEEVAEEGDCGDEKERCHDAERGARRRERGERIDERDRELPGQEGDAERGDRQRDEPRVIERDPAALIRGQPVPQASLPPASPEPGFAERAGDGDDPRDLLPEDDRPIERSDQRAERFAVGEQVDARVIQFDKKARKVQVSIKALEVAEEKEAIAQYGSSDSGATLGDILGTALKQRTDK